MSDLTFDSLKLVRERAQLQGSLPVAGLARLAESVCDSGGTLTYRVQGTQDPRNRPMLKLRVQGEVQLQCQRCLEGFRYAVDIDTPLRLVAPDELDREYEEHGSDPDEPECIAHSATLDLAQLIEEEVLLALPPYPRHGDGACRARAAAGASAGAKITAFSALQALKQKGSFSKE